MSDIKPNYKLFSVFGIEIEYMIVDKQSLNPLPIADKVIQILNNGIITNEVEIGEIAVSNELALHVIELKTNGPVAELNNLEKPFAKVLAQIQVILDEFHAILLPTGMHPWFVPDASLRLWPHSNTEIYSAYNKIFDCKGHGWGNLQSTHINLPFANEQEFAILHEAIRIILPIIPALSASTPFVSGDINGSVDNRLLYYGTNQVKIPCISGQIIPEHMTTYQDYQEQILNRMYSEIAPYDKEGILQHEWLNSRGAIARFERNAIEIRILDSQESPLMDLICIMLVVYVLRDFIQNKVKSSNSNNTTQELVNIYKTCIEHGSKAVITDIKYLEYLGYDTQDSKTATAQEIWQYLFKQIKQSIPITYHSIIEKHLQLGTLSERLLNSYHKNNELNNIYNKLHTCLLSNTLFEHE